MRKFAFFFFFLIQNTYFISSSFIMGLKHSFRCIDFHFSSKKYISESVFFNLLLDIFFEVVRNWHLLLFSTCIRILCPLSNIGKISVHSERQYKCNRQKRNSNNTKAYKSTDRAFSCFIIFFSFSIFLFSLDRLCSTVSSIKCQNVPTPFLSINTLWKMSQTHTRQKPKNIHRVNRKEKIHDSSSFI